MADKKSKVFEEMAAGLVHEVKNPLSLVHAHLDLLELDEKEASTKAHFHRMREELEKINDLIVEFLTLSTDTIEDSVFMSEKIYLDYLWRELLIPFELAYPKMTFILENGAADFSMHGSVEALEEAFQIVLKNAVEATKQQGIVQIKIIQKEDTFHCFIQDNGPGMGKDAIEKFANNKRVHSTKKDGSGFGLYQMRKIINEHHGSVTIRNNQGLLIEMTFPENKTP